MPIKNPGEQLDTGTGGFPVNSNRQTYDVGIESSEASNEQWSSGQINVDSSPKDISEGTKKTLASYLSQTTLGKTASAGSSAPNKYPIKHLSNENPTSLTLQDKNTGLPTGPIQTNSPNIYAKNYIPGDERSPVFEEAKTRSKIDGNSLLKDFTSLGRQSYADRNGFNPAFSNEPKSGDKNNPISQYYGESTNQLSNSVIYNRFNPELKYSDYSVSDDTKLLKGLQENLQGAPQLVRPQFAAKYEMGRSMSPEDVRRNLSYGRLAQIGNSLSVRSGLEIGSSEPGSNPTNNKAQANALLPGINQLGVERIERSLLEARDVINNLTIDEIDSSLLINPANLSWGSLNNVNDQFSGISNFGMQLLAAALVVAISVAYSAFVGLFSLIMGGSTTSQTKSDQLSRRVYGASISSKSGGDYSSISGVIQSALSGKFDIWGLLGLPHTSYPLERCLAVGGLSFFGVSSPEATISSMASKALDAAASVTQSPGYYSVMARNVSRSFLMIGDGFQNLGKAFSSGFTAGIKQLFEMIDTLRNSKFIKILGVFSHLGNTIILMSSKEKLFDDSSVGSPYKRFNSTIDMNDNIDAASKNRLKTDGTVSSLTLAWASYRSPDLFIMPQGISSIRSNTVSDDKLGTPGLFSNISTGKGGLKYGNPYVEVEDSARIDTEKREEIEDALESEYVPFYIHDVRTNEILSFHAFLASLSDDYTANYDSTDGFGRVESIKTYKSTSRKIGFSFYVVATNPDDFDYMWTKINKLTTMVYPQFSEGRTLVDQNKKYSIQMPFSQTIQASPLVRLRIGDLIKSNYSKFNLARLFGYGSPNSTFEGKSYSTTPSEYSILYEEQFKVGAKMVLKSGLLGPPVQKPTIPGLSSVLPSNVPPPTTTEGLPPGFVLNVEKIEDDLFYCTVEEAKDDDAQNLTNEQKNNMKRYMGRGGDDDNIFQKTYRIHRADLALAPSQKKKIKDRKGPSSEYVKAVNEFMDDQKGNAIVRSFRSSGGKGLAGFIDSLNFDWYERTTWEIGRGTQGTEPIPGRRAPKMCKVTVSFSPIHDIAPGLDHMGFNRAPIYPVGPYSNNDSRRKK